MGQSTGGSVCGLLLPFLCLPFHPRGSQPLFPSLGAERAREMHTYASIRLRARIYTNTELFVARCVQKRGRGRALLMRSGG